MQVSEGVAAKLADCEFPRQRTYIVLIGVDIDSQLDLAIGSSI